MINYSPFFKTLNELNMKPSDLRGVILTSDTLAKFRKNEPVNLTTIDRICIYLRVPIEKVVRIDYEKE